MDVPERILTAKELSETCTKLGFRVARRRCPKGGYPPDLAPLLPYVEIWGHDDEDTRFRLSKKTPVPLRKHLRWIFVRSDIYLQMEEWLTGPALAERPLSDAYVAFSNLNMTLSEV